MVVLKRDVRAAVLVLLLLALPACDEAPASAQQAERANGEAAGFQAVITGAYDGRVSGAGVLKFLPETGFDRQGYYFLSDAQGIRPHGVTFVLPRDLAPGNYGLESPSPLSLGTVPSVRVDRDMGDSVQSFDRNTTGTLDVTAFPDDGADLAGSTVAGRFDFETENASGRRIRVSGKFSFAAE
jgi:hypothetical protein